MFFAFQTKIGKSFCPVGRSLSIKTVQVGLMTDSSVQDYQVAQDEEIGKSLKKALILWRLIPSPSRRKHLQSWPWDIWESGLELSLTLRLQAIRSL
jgi:hypothetical protein